MFDINEAIQAACDAIVDMFNALYDLIKRVADAIVKVVKYAVKYITMNGNGRVRHLALYAKKKRVRKKNFNRFWKEVKDENQRQN